MRTPDKPVSKPVGSWHNPVTGADVPIYAAREHDIKHDNPMLRHMPNCRFAFQVLAMGLYDELIWVNVNRSEVTLDK